MSHFSDKMEVEITLLKQLFVSCVIRDVQVDLVFLLHAI